MVFKDVEGKLWLKCHGIMHCDSLCLGKVYPWESERLTGHMTRPTKAQIYPPRRISIYLGNRAVISVPAETEFAAMFVPSCASVNAVAIKKTPTRFCDDPSARNECRRSRGFQMGSPLKMTVEDEDTMMPMMDVTPKPQGMVRSWERKASWGLRAKRAKSGTFWMLG